jgi:hypothetical protein
MVPHATLPVVEAIVTGGAGFLLAVLWFDLMFDVQVRGHREPVLPEAVLASIAGYYARVTTAARPMNRFVALGMVVTLGGVVAEVVGDSVGTAPALLSLALAVPPIAMAGGRIVPAAMRLGGRGDTVEAQSAAARSIYRGHVLCFVLVASLLTVQGITIARAH